MYITVFWKLAFSCVVTAHFCPLQSKLVCKMIHCCILKTCKVLNIIKQLWSRSWARSLDWTCLFLSGHCIFLPPQSQMVYKIILYLLRWYTVQLVNMLLCIILVSLPIVLFLNSTKVITLRHVFLSLFFRCSWWFSCCGSIWIFHNGLIHQRKWFGSFY